MAKQAAGLLVYRTGEELEVFLVHPGGPFYSKKDDGVWSIPKGLFEADEDPLTAARREFEEETGQKIAGDFFKLKPITQKGGKIVFAWAVEAEVDAENIVSNTFEMEWPPKSGKMREFPEVDRGAWFDVDTAKRKINPAQAALVDELISRV
ncbi:MAG: NUDIX hydrolase [Acidobacteria bacterium]|nr:MAG: NUDIX hydrolase [Acidobacteriota bacterium]